MIVALSVLAALAFVGRRGWMHLQSVVSTKASVSSSCISACGGCAKQQPAQDQKDLYQILPTTKSLR